MTAMRGYVPAAEKGLGVHSLDHFVLAVPDLVWAQRFYSDFGLDVQPAGGALGLKTFGHEQHWGVVVEGKRKKLHHLSFGCYPDDLPYLQERAEASGVELLNPPKGFESNGFWFRDPAGLLIEIKVAAKTSPAHKTCGTWASSPEGVAGAPVRAKAPMVRPRRLSHVLVFTPTSIVLWISIRQLSACACRTVPIASPSCTRSTAATTTFWRSRSRLRQACTTAAGM